MMIGLDTNILVRYIAQDDEQQSPRANEILENELSADHRGFIGSVVLVELCWTLKRLYQVNRQNLSVILERLLRAEELSFEHQDEVWAALQLFRSSNVEFADAFIGFVHKKYGCGINLTFDKAASQSDLFASP